jgi:phosphoglycolate phosphatase-like HAD superfamily hydrolase
MSSLSGIKAIGFDLDDTLVMTEPSAFETENRILAQMGRPSMDREVHYQTWGGKLDEMIAIRSPGVNVDEFMRLFAEEFQRRLKSNEVDHLTEEVENTLIRLGDKGYYLFLLTNRDGFETVHLSEGRHPISLHIAPENVYHKDNVTSPKPSPAAFDWLWRKGFKPDECVYVGDSVIDGQAASGAGMHFIATLESGIRSREDFKDIPVAMFINKFSELTELIN